MFGLTSRVIAISAINTKLAQRRGYHDNAPAMQSESLLNIHDYAHAAAQKLPKGVLDYYAGGALDEVALRENV